MHLLIRLVASLTLLCVFIAPAAFAIGRQVSTFLRGSSMDLLTHTFWSALYCGVLWCGFFALAIVWYKDFRVKFWCGDPQASADSDLGNQAPGVQACISKGRNCTAEDLTALSLDGMQAVLAHFQKQDPAHWRALRAQIDRLGSPTASAVAECVRLDAKEASTSSSPTTFPGDVETKAKAQASLGQPNPPTEDVVRVLLLSQTATLFRSLQQDYNTPDHGQILTDEALVLLWYARHPNSWPISAWGSECDAHVTSRWSPEVQEAVAVLNTWHRLTPEQKIAGINVWRQYATSYGDSEDLPLMTLPRVQEWHNNGALEKYAKWKPETPSTTSAVVEDGPLEREIEYQQLLDEQNQPR